MGSMQGKRVVVMGGSGFLGSHLCERLLADGAAFVLSVDNLVTGSATNHAHLKNEARFDFLNRGIHNGVGERLSQRQ